MNSACFTTLAAPSRPAARALRAALLAFPVLGASACADTATGPSQRRVETVLADVMARHPVPAMAAAVIRDGGIVAQGAIGVRRLGSSEPVGVRDRFHIASNVKAMTATMIATLVEDGKLRWTTTPTEVFPELAAGMHPQLRGATVEQLLQHRAGLAPYETLDEILALPVFTGNATQQRLAFAAYLLQRPPAVAPGTYLYSNGGYDVAAAMAERVSGRSWETLMQERLFAPLGMQATRGWPAALDPNQPWGHEWTGTTFQPTDPNGPFQMPDILAAAGDLSLSLQDYARFVQLHLRGARGHARLVSKESFVRLQTPNGDYALGWVVGMLGGSPFLGHEGTSGSFHATVLIFPTRNIAVVVLVNGGGGPAPIAAGEAALELAGITP
ncbi:MAG TPA: serine hydrolase domain-containing protein [Gemmatimonadaceae bacterium]|nr:serine hydrolase domain-containing protein [Gemmatimonadaceae bacterium]